MVDAGGLPVLFDSGVRSGADVIKALALGATAVAIGRPYAYGLAIGGADGIVNVLRSILAEADLIMAVDGYPTLADLTRESLAAPAPATPPSTSRPAPPGPRGQPSPSAPPGPRGQPPPPASRPALRLPPALAASPPAPPGPRGQPSGSLAMPARPCRPRAASPRRSIQPGVSSNPRSPATLAQLIVIFFDYYEISTSFSQECPSSMLESN